MVSAPVVGREAITSGEGTSDVAIVDCIEYLYQARTFKLSLVQACRVHRCGSLLVDWIRINSRCGLLKRIKLGQRRWYRW